MYSLFASYYNQIFPFKKSLYEPLLNHAYNRVLDLGCGTGRLTNLLAKVSNEIIGIDLDPQMIEMAMTSYPALDFRIQNIMNLEHMGKFNLITCFGNTMAHLNRQEFSAFFAAVEQALTSDGTMWIQLLNYDRILDKNINTLSPIIQDEFSFYRTYTKDEQALIFHTTLQTTKGVAKGKVKLYPYRYEDFITLKESTHINVYCFGSLDEKPYDLENDYYLYVKVNKKGSN